MKISETDAPESNLPEQHEARFTQLGLTWGAAAIYRDADGTFWATGDYAHCGEAIDKNINRMVEIMEAEKLTYLAKDYTSTLYKSHGRITEADWVKALSDHSTNHLTALNPRLPIAAM